MSASITDIYTINITISNRKELFIAKASKLIFDGYRKIYDDVKNDDDDTNENEELSEDFIIDNNKKDDLLKYLKITCSEKFESCIPHYNEASLIKKMEKIGIGRPSTYSNIIETIIERKYVEKKDIKGKKIDISVVILEKDDIKNKKENIIIGGEKKKIIPTDLGITTTAFLEKNFGDILDSNFTSTLEEKLDSIANNNMIWYNVIKEFYEIFIVSVNNLDNKDLISKNNDDKKRFVGNNADNKKIYAYIGKYGPVLQVGEEKDVKFIKVDAKYSINTITLDDYNEITKYPKKLGLFENNDVLLKNGQYGFYISYSEKNYKLINDFDENLSLEDGIKCITPSENKKEIKIDKYIIKEGPYGFYILYNKKFYNIPKSYDIDKLTKENCVEIIKIPKYKKLIK